MEKRWTRMQRGMHENIALAWKTSYFCNAKFYFVFGTNAKLNIDVGLFGFSLDAFTHYMNVRQVLHLPVRDVYPRCFMFLKAASRVGGALILILGFEFRFQPTQLRWAFTDWCFPPFGCNLRGTASGRVAILTAAGRIRPSDSSWFGVKVSRYIQT